MALWLQEMHEAAASARGMRGGAENTPPAATLKARPRTAMAYEGRPDRSNSVRKMQKQHERVDPAAGRACSPLLAHHDESKTAVEMPQAPASQQSLGVGGVAVGGGMPGVWRATDRSRPSAKRFDTTAQPARLPCTPLPTYPGWAEPPTLQMGDDSREGGVGLAGFGASWTIRSKAGDFFGTLHGARFQVV